DRGSGMMGSSFLVPDRLCSDAMGPGSCCGPVGDQPDAPARVRSPAGRAGAGDPLAGASGRSADGTDRPGIEATASDCNKPDAPARVGSPAGRAGAGDPLAGASGWSADGANQPGIEATVSPGPDVAGPAWAGVAAPAGPAAQPEGVLVPRREHGPTTPAAAERTPENEPGPRAAERTPENE